MTWITDNFHLHPKMLNNEGLQFRENNIYLLIWYLFIYLFFQFQKMFICMQDFQEIQIISKKLAQRKNKATIRGRKYKKEKEK